MQSLHSLLSSFTCSYNSSSSTHSSSCCCFSCCLSCSSVPSTSCGSIFPFFSLLDYTSLILLVFILTVSLAFFFLPLSGSSYCPLCCVSIPSFLSRLRPYCSSLLSSVGLLHCFYVLFGSISLCSCSSYFLRVHWPWLIPSYLLLTLSFSYLLCCS